MNVPILKRTRQGTLVLAIAVALALQGRVDPSFQAGIMGSALWAVLGFWAVEVLVKQALVPPGEPKNGRLIGLLVFGKIALYTFAAWALLKEIVPPMSCVVGFSLLLIVLVLMAVTGNAKTGIPPTPRGHDDDANEV